MKKLLFIMMLFVGLTANAQQWEKRTTPADVMKGTRAQTYYFIQLDSITSLKVNADDDQWRLYTKFSENAFKIKLKAFQTQLSELQTRATFGRFDPDGNLIPPLLQNIKMTASDRGQSIGMGKYTANESLLITDYLKKEHGWVEMIVPLFFGGEYRVKMPCIPDSIK